jgi:hypothetical protein
MKGLADFVGSYESQIIKFLCVKQDYFKAQMYDTVTGTVSWQQHARKLPNALYRSYICDVES